MAIEKPTPELTREICESLATGMLLADAAALAGVDRQTLAEWKRLAEKGTEPYAATRHELVKAELLAQRRLLTKLSLAASNDPKYAGWLLTHRWAGWRKGVVEDVPTILATPEGSDAKALAGTILLRYPLLPWESTDEFEALVTGLLTEHQPQGPTEQHLVAELAGVLLRKGRACSGPS